MSKNKVVIFTPNNARIIVTNDPAKYRKMPNALLNPDLSKVALVAPQYWKLVGGKVAEMNNPEKLARDADIRVNGAFNELVELPVSRLRIRLYSRLFPIVYAFLLGVTIGWIFSV